MGIMGEKGLRMVVIGPPGAGKDTQAGFICKRYKLKMLSVGGILREEVSKRSRIGRMIKKDMESGNLVDDKILNMILKKKLKKESRILIDGFPRDLSQAMDFGEISYALYIACNKTNIMKRLLRRARIEKRKDDNRKVINHRWRVFTEETIPVVEYYRKKGILREIDGNGSVEEVNELAMDLLGQDGLFQRLIKR